MSDANEEYFHSEKYELRQRDWDDPRSIADCLTKLNEIRRRHPALQRLRNIDFQGSTNPNLLAYAKRSDDGTDVVLTVVNLDPWNVQEGVLRLELERLGLPLDGPYEAYDELSNSSFTWRGAEPYVRLDPYDEVAHVLHLRPLS
jgi:starch synthase (maltosyl-transferring)